MSTQCQHVRVGVACIVIRQGHLLMHTRKGSHGADTWCIPGGHQEFGQSPEQAAINEVAEETGVSVAIRKRLPYNNDYMPDENRHYITLFFECQYLSGEPTVTEPDFCPIVAWVPLTEVRNKPLFSPFQHFLDQYPEVWEQLTHS